MASIFASSDGTIIGFSATFAEARSFFSLPPPNSAASLDLDESTNAPLITDIQAHLALYRLPLVAGVATLQKNGVAVTIAAPSPLYSLQTTILNGVPDATLKATIVALWNGNATQAQRDKALAYMALKMKQAGLI